MTTTAPFPPITEDLVVQVRGLWRLVSRVDADDHGTRMIDPVLGPSPLGALAFGPQSFAAQFMNPDRDARASSAPGSGANNSGAVNGYDAYFGTYSIDPAAGTVTVRLEGGLTAANIGQAYVREIRANALNLWIRLRTSAVDGTPITRTLTFVRDRPPG
ncbi:MAG TPA: lipocalin-like domain-containing protein [Gemmatimonadales bacterium]|nr:lipocalin-like domain-containing protein [Gemmatimonadales bacterium]